PNRFYQHAARTDRDHNGPLLPPAISTLTPTIWDRLSPIPNTEGIPTGGYFFRDLPFLGLWGLSYLPFWHAFSESDSSAITGLLTALLTSAHVPPPTISSIISSTLSQPFLQTVADRQLPNVSFVDPAFITGDTGTSGDDHPLSDIRLGERFIADVYHALDDAG